MKNFIGLLIILLCISSANAYPQLELVDGDTFIYSDGIEFISGYNMTLDSVGNEIEVLLSQATNTDPMSPFYQHNREGAFLGSNYYTHIDGESNLYTSIFEDHSPEELSSSIMTVKVVVDKNSNDIIFEYGSWDMDIQVEYIGDYTFELNQIEFDGLFIKYNFLWSTLNGYLTYINGDYNRTWSADGGTITQFHNGGANDTDIFEYSQSDYNDSIMIGFIPGLHRPSSITRFLEDEISNPFRDEFFPMYNRGLGFNDRVLTDFEIQSLSQFPTTGFTWMTPFPTYISFASVVAIIIIRKFGNFLKTG